MEVVPAEDGRSGISTKRDFWMCEVFYLKMVVGITIAIRGGRVLVTAVLMVAVAYLQADTQISRIYGGFLSATNDFEDKGK